jgi:hypothetical protein
MWASELYDSASLSPETPLARDAHLATRSVALARTTHHLATVHHETRGYFPGHPVVKGIALQTLDACNSKK